LAVAFSRLAKPKGRHRWVGGSLPWTSLRRHRQLQPSLFWQGTECSECELLGVRGSAWWMVAYTRSWGVRPP